MKYLFAAVCSVYAFTCLSQTPPAVSYPQDYFRDPLAVPMSLAANFGELRPNHYHMGLDIRTQHKENLSVFAAADGYIARVTIESAGFGQAIYIRHPNGLTTVYGHLNKFFPALAAYVAQQQYKLESWQVSLDLPPSLFPVKKGNLIAFSGNTGGSQGPHLHFEIRRTNGNINLNPLLFGFPVPDHTPPSILRLAYYDRNQGIYEQSPHILPVLRDAKRGKAGSSQSDGWTIHPALLTVPITRVSFAISAFDTQAGAGNTNGIYLTTLYDNDQPVVGFRMDSINYDDTRNINAHIDYKTKLTGGTFLQQLFFLQGYPFPSIYRAPAPPYGADPANHGSVSPGLIDLRDGRPHRIRIEVSDTYGNTSTLPFSIQYRPAPLPAGKRPTGKAFYPGMVDGVETADCAFYLGEKCLYDSVHIDHTVAGYPGSGLSLPGGVSAVHTIGALYIPLLDPLLVRLKPATAFSADSVNSREWEPHGNARIVMVNFNGTQKDVRRPEWQGGWASARFREFGSFQLVNDTIPPVITSLYPLEGANLGMASRIALVIKDDLGALRTFRAELDGKWLCFTNDKGLAYIYTFDEHCPPGAHVLRVAAEDVAGNRSLKEFHFNR
jgi:Peptidase family M23